MAGLGPIGEVFMNGTKAAVEALVKRPKILGGAFEEGEKGFANVIAGARSDVVRSLPGEFFIGETIEKPIEEAVKGIRPGEHLSPPSTDIFIPPNNKAACTSPILETKANSQITGSEVNQYLGFIKGDVGAAKLDRSKFFRYLKDLFHIDSIAQDAISSNKKISFAQIGVGNGEEALSDLAVINKTAEKAGKKLEDIVDLKLIDIRPSDEINIKFGYGTTNELPGGGKMGSFFLNPEQIRSAKKVPIKPDTNIEQYFVPPTGSEMEYTFYPAVREKVTKSLINSDKAGLLGTPIETIAPNMSQQYDVVACNNVFQHMGIPLDEYAKELRSPLHYLSPIREKVTKTSTDLIFTKDEYPEFYSHLENVLNMVKPGGTFISHTDKMTSTTAGSDWILNNVTLFKNEFEEIGTGIYRRRVA